jgi:hypothetical protein
MAVSFIKGIGKYLFKMKDKWETYVNERGEHGAKRYICTGTQYSALRNMDERSLC